MPLVTFLWLLHSLEEVNVGKLLHLIDFDGIDNLFVVEQHPNFLRGLLRAALSNKGDVMATRTVSLLNLGAMNPGESNEN